MPKPDPQYLRTGLRHNTRHVLEALPGWLGVRIAGHDPAQIRTVEGLLVWLEGYRKVVEGLRAEAVTERASRVKLGNRYADLATACRAAGLDPDELVAGHKAAKA